MSDLTPSVTTLCQDIKEKVDKSIDHYADKFSDVKHKGKPALDMDHAGKMTETFYNLVTDFYEYGWGQSFHFTALYDDKSFEECIADYEREVARLIGAKPGMKILDIGCGVGGPGREIARTSGASVVGFNYSEYQIERAKKHTKKAHLGHLCTYMKGDFLNMHNIEDNSYDGAFAFEATCHARDLLTVYKEVYRVLKPGGIFVDLSWVMTDSYDPENTQHVKVKTEIMFGNSLVDVRTPKEVIACMREAGLEVMEFRDLEKEGDYPWYTTLTGGKSCSCSLMNFRMSSAGRFFTHNILWVLETFSLVPKGTLKISSMLEVGANSLVQSGKMGIFTPLLRCVARKPIE